jgi:hypothetical protein
MEGTKRFLFTIETINKKITSRIKTTKSYSSRNFRSQTNFTDSTFTINHKCLKKRKRGKQNDVLLKLFFLQMILTTLDKGQK